MKTALGSSRRFLLGSSRDAAEQIAAGIQDFVGLGRPFLADPSWPEKTELGREDEIVSCINCLHCFETLLQNAWLAKPIECSRNSLLGKETD